MSDLENAAPFKKQRKPGFLQAIFRKREAGIVLALVIMSVGITIVAPRFATGQNFYLLSRFSVLCNNGFLPIIFFSDFYGFVVCNDPHVFRHLYPGKFGDFGFFLGEKMRVSPYDRNFSSHC